MYSAIDDYRRRIRQIHRQLGITDTLGRRIKLPLQLESRNLADAGTDVLHRPVQLEPDAHAQWQRMASAAAADGVCLQLVSGFRSVDYQTTLIRRKLSRGLAMEEILRVNAPPGHSEHHTGRALDLTTPGCPLLEAEFEETDAFRWLCDRAGRFGFSLSYPRNNPYGIIHEPWHWAWRD